MSVLNRVPSHSACIQHSTTSQQLLDPGMNPRQVVVYRTKPMTFIMGDPPSRHLMNLDPGEMYCFVHYDLLPLILENFQYTTEGHVI